MSVLRRVKYYGLLKATIKHCHLDKKSPQIKILSYCYCTAKILYLKFTSHFAILKIKYTIKIDTIVKTHYEKNDII